MPFELPPWLTESANPFEALAKGAAVGVQLGRAFADNMYRSQALYVRARQDQQEQELRFRQLAQRDSQLSLQSEVARTKMAHDTEDYNTLKAFVPTVSSARTFDELNAINLPPLHDTQNYLKMSLMLDRTKTEKAMGELGGELATTTNWADPAVYGIINKWIQKAPDLSLMPATQHLMGRHQAAVVAARTANRLEEESKSRIAGREERADYNAKSLALRQLLADHNIPLTDARVVKAQQEAALAERRMLVQEGNLALRGQEIGQKETRLGIREQFVEERNALIREENDVLKSTYGAEEKKRLRMLYNIRRREIWKKFYGPNATKAETKVPEPATTAHDPRVPRADLKTEDRTTNAPPAMVAPNNDVRAEEIRTSFRDGKITKEQALQQLRELGFK